MKFGIDIARAFRENETKVKKRYEKKIERLEMDNALVRGGNEEKRNQIKSLESTLATCKVVVEKVKAYDEAVDDFLEYHHDVRNLFNAIPILVKSHREYRQALQAVKEGE